MSYLYSKRMIRHPYQTTDQFHYLVVWGKYLKSLFSTNFEYFQRNFLISIWQSGFIPGHSTVSHLVEMYDTFCRTVSEGKEIRVVFCDVSRAFDRV